MNWPEIITALKDLSGTRFYFIVTLIFFLIIGNVYKDTISVAVKEVTFSRVEFRECRDLKGLEVALETLSKRDSIINNFTVYIYQPKDRSYYKKVILTNDDLVKSTLSLQGSYIEDQPTINKQFADNSYMLLNSTMDNTDTRFMRELGIDHLLIYKLHNKTDIGEIYIGLKHQPSPQELTDLLKALSPLMYIYII